MKGALFRAPGLAGRGPSLESGGALLSGTAEAIGGIELCRAACLLVAIHAAIIAVEGGLQQSIENREEATLIP